MIIFDFLNGDNVLERKKIADQMFTVLLYLGALGAALKTFSISSRFS